MEPSTLNLQFAIGVAVAAVSLFTAAIAFGFGAARPRLRFYSLLALGAGGYAICDIMLAFAVNPHLVPPLSRMQLFFSAICFPGWFGYVREAGGAKGQPVPPDRFDRLFRRVMQGVLVIAALAPLPGVFYTNHVLVFTYPKLGLIVRDTEPTWLGQFAFGYLVVALVCGAIQLVRLAFAGQIGSISQIVGCVALFIGGTNDALVISGAIHSLFLLPSAYGIAMAACGFAIVQSFVADTRKLDLLSQELEKHVRERTAELTIARASMRRSERLAAIGTLSAGVAHEVNNPLAAIAGNLGFLVDRIEKNGTPPPDLVPVLRDSSELAGRIGRIVRQLLTAGRAAGGAPAVRPVHLASAVKAAIDGLPAELRALGTLQLQIPTCMHVRGDDVHLMQIFGNLLANALQAVEGCEERVVTVHAEILRADPASEETPASEERGPGSVRICVHDTGTGMTSAVQDRLFEPFFTTKTGGKGTGLGLAITHELVVALGGTIVCTPNKPRGTSFVVVLDSAAPEEPGVRHRARTRSEDFADLRSPEASALPTVATRARLRILVIDDEPALRQSIRRMLAQDFEIVLEDDPVRALDRLFGADDSPGGFGAILCDVVMPNGGGEGFYRALLSRDPTLARRIVFMTGGAPDERTRNFLIAQPQPVLEKPFRRSDVVSILDRVGAPESASVSPP